MSDVATIIMASSVQPTSQKEIIGNNLKYYRSLCHMTQAQLSEKVDCSTSTISRIECGDIYMSVELLLKLSETLNVSCDALLKPACNDVRILNICNMLKNSSESFVEAVEKMIFAMGSTCLST